VDAASSTFIKYPPLGKKLMTVTVGEQPDNGSPFDGTTDVAFGPNGRIFITDGYSNARVLEYTAEGRKVKQWGKPGSAPGEFNLPHAIQIDSQGIIYVADRENGRIEKFDLNGNFLGEIDHLGRTYSLKLTNRALWASMGPFDQPPGAPGWVVKLDPGEWQDIGSSRYPRGARRTFHRTDAIRRTDHHTEQRTALVQETGSSGLFRRLLRFSTTQHFRHEVPRQQ
jgi:hypothetical protein